MKIILGLTETSCHYDQARIYFFAKGEEMIFIHEINKFLDSVS